MIIYFLQTGLSPPILPPLKSYVDNLEKVNVNTQLQHLVPKTFIKFDIRNKEELGDIFVKFFQFWVKKFRQNKIFSLYTAQESIRTYNQPFLDTSAYVLVIQGKMILIRYIFLRFKLPYSMYFSAELAFDEFDHKQ